MRESVCVRGVQMVMELANGGHLFQLVSAQVGTHTRTWPYKNVRNGGVLMNFVFVGKLGLGDG